ncbi:unnamed protein product [Mytilus edulis]|uniref:Uncharacterized protein n=1 Tax=Mytilus edulis TaxID=6550 RepID=A0A8S3REL3_MYTED|nr:unnamed protein product [Mytilus edulis]
MPPPPQDKRGRGQDTSNEDSVDGEDEDEDIEVDSDCCISFSPETQQSVNIESFKKKLSKKKKLKKKKLKAIANLLKESKPEPALKRSKNKSPSFRRRNANRYAQWMATKTAVEPATEQQTTSVDHTNNTQTEARDTIVGQVLTPTKYKEEPIRVVINRDVVTSPYNPNKASSPDLLHLHNRQGQAQCSIDWCYGFLRRHDLSIRRRTHISQKLPADYEDKLLEFQKYIIKVRKQNNYLLSQIGNADQTPLTFDLPADTTIDHKDTSTANFRSTGNEKKNRFTVKKKENHAKDTPSCKKQPRRHPKYLKRRTPFKANGSEPDNNVVNGDDSHLSSIQSEDNPVEIKGFPQDKHGRGQDLEIVFDSSVNVSQVNGETENEPDLVAKAESSIMGTRKISAEGDRRLYKYPLQDKSAREQVTSEDSDHKEEDIEVESECCISFRPETQQSVEYLIVTY